MWLVMVLLVCQMFGEDVRLVFFFVYSVEVFYNFSLVYDDIMDVVYIWCGQLIVYIKYGLNSGILLGDVMFIYVYDELCKIECQEVVGQFVNILSEVVIKVCEGQ